MAKTKEARTNESRDPRQDQQPRREHRSESMQPRRENEMQRSSSPFGFMRRFNEEMDRLFQDFGFGRGFSEPSFGREIAMFGKSGPSMWSPQVEVFERGGELCVRADLPGMTKDDIEVDVAENAIVIRGERRNEGEDEQEGYYRTERSYGSFYRTILLPEAVNAENAEATFHNGVLEITMPAPERAGRRRLEVREREQERPRSQTKAAGQR